MFLGKLPTWASPGDERGEVAWGSEDGEVTWEVERRGEVAGRWLER